MSDFVNQREQQGEGGKLGQWDGPAEERHELTEAERQKGRETVTERKRKALALNPAIHGHYSKSGLLPDEFLNCDSCKHRKACSFYRSGDSCKIQGMEPLKQLAQLYGADASELLQTINKELISYGIKARHSDKLADQNAWIKLLMEFFRLRFGSKEFIMQVSRNLSDEEFESLVDIYQRKVLVDERRNKKRASEDII